MRERISGMRKINLIVVHCTATPDGRDVTVADIDKMHRAKGWKSIGYHYVIYRDGSVHEGRPVTEVGAHVYGQLDRRGLRGRRGQGR